MTTISLEQKARDILERMGVEGAQNFTAGDLVELSNAMNHKVKPGYGGNHYGPQTIRVINQAEFLADSENGSSEWWPA